MATAQGPRPPIFLISLPDAEARRDIMRARMRRAGVEGAFVDGVDGHEIDMAASPLYDGTRRRRYFGRDLTPGEFGCLLAHRSVYERIVAEGIPAAVVLEDDVIFEDDFTEVVDALTRTPVPWDLVRFLSQEKTWRRGYRAIAPLSGRYRLVRLPSTPGGAYGYMLTLGAARTLIAHTERNWLPIDALHGRVWQTGLDVLAVQPPPLHPDRVIDSSIGEARFDKGLVRKGGTPWAYPAFRLVYKLSESLAKRLAYAARWPRDRANRARAAKSGL